MTEREGSDTRRLHVDPFQRFTPQQRAAWIAQGRENERRRRALMREAGASRRAKIGRERERSILFELIGDPYIRDR
jgi:hypothetical protein